MVIIMNAFMQGIDIVAGKTKDDCENRLYVKIINWIERFARAEARNSRAKNSKEKSNY